MWQAHWVQAQLLAAGLPSELVTFETKGDVQLSQSLSAIGSKGLFTEELEDGLLTGQLDIAVHSAKDLQTELKGNLHILAISHREAAHDVVLSLDPTFTLKKAQEEGLVVGSSSTRRRAFLEHFYPGIKTVENRGNLQTRLAKMKSGTCAGMLLAYAGVHRMEMEDYVVEHLPLDAFVPAAGQGALAIEASKGLDTAIAAAIRQSLNDDSTEKAVQAERHFLRTLEGGCSIPVFAFATVTSTGLNFHGGVISLDGKSSVVKKAFVHQPEDTIALAKALLLEGGKEILDEIKAHKK